MGVGKGWRSGPGPGRVDWAWRIGRGLGVLPLGWGSAGVRPFRQDTAQTFCADLTNLKKGVDFCSDTELCLPQQQNKRFQPKLKGGMNMSTTPNIELILNTTIGIEVEMTGITREKAATVAATVLGGCSIYKGGTYGKWVCIDNRGREWAFVSDASIHAVNERGRRVDNRSGYSCELNTPPITYAEDMEKFQELIRALRSAGAVSGTQYGCGIHIHVSGKGHTVKTVKNFIHLLYSNDEVIRKSLGVTDDRQRWCQPIDTRLVEAVKNADTLEKLADAWYETYSPDEERYFHYNSSRYHILNLHRYFSTLGKKSNTIEIRAFNASLHAGEIRAYALLVLSMNASALTQKNIRALKNPIMQAGNEKFAMRTWLNRMGWTGEMYKNPHKLFIKRLSGDAAWRFGKNGDLYR